MADDTSIPMGEPASGSPKIPGPIRPNATELATHLKRTPIAIGAVAMLGMVLAVVYVAIEVIPHMGGGVPTPAPQAPKAPDIKVPKRQPAPSAAGTTSGAPPATGSPPATGLPANAVPPQVPAVPPVQGTSATAAQPSPSQGASPQDTAFQQALKGGSMSGSWAREQGRAPRPAQPASSSLAAMLQAAHAGKQAQQHHQSVYDTHLVRKEVSPYELLQGSVIPATLETGIKSDIAGQVKAVVSHPVYNSLNGAFVLIPAGSTLVGSYQSGAAMGQNRVGVYWTRIEFPDGTTIQLGKMMGASPSGYAGFQDLVNDHTWEIFKNALLLSLIDVGMAMSSPQSTSTNTTGVTGNEALQNGEQSLAQTFGEAEAQLFQKDINISPTITIRPGYEFNVIVARDLVFPGPYVHGVNEVGSGAVRQPAIPSEANPYVVGNPYAEGH